MLKGIVIKPLKRMVDERGSFTEIFRKDWPELIDEKEEILQANLSVGYPGIVRAWHKHEREQNDYFTCIKGAIKICLYDDIENSSTKGELNEFILSDKKIQLLKVPGKYWHGYKVIGIEPAMLLYGVNNLYEYGNPDELRRSWDDPEIIPYSINGKKTDPRIGKPWDWNFLPYK